MKLKAYAVSDGESDVIEFANSGIVARRHGANELNIEFEGADYCRRAPEFDQYAPGPITDKTFFEAGWNFLCAECNKHVCKDHYPDAVFTEGGAFCSPACYMRSYAKDRIKADMVELALAKFPGAWVTSVYLTYSTEKLDDRVIAWLSFPLRTHENNGAGCFDWAFGATRPIVPTVYAHAFRERYGECGVEI